MRIQPPTSAARERILDTAGELFYEYGIQKVGVDTVISAAGVAKMTLYRHFRSKEELVAAYLSRRDARWREWFEQRVVSVEAPARERLLMVFDVLEEWFATDGFHGCAFINAKAEHAGAPAEQVIREHKLAMREMLGSLAQEAGLENSEEVAGELFLLMEGTIVTARMEGDPSVAAQARRTAQRLVGA